MRRTNLKIVDCCSKWPITWFRKPVPSPIPNCTNPDQFGPKTQPEKKGWDCNESVFVWCVLWASTSNGIINVQVVKSQFVILQVLNYLSILVIYYFIYNSFKNIRIIIVTLNNYYLIRIIFPVKSALISWPLIGGLRFEISWHGADHLIKWWRCGARQFCVSLLY